MKQRSAIRMVALFEALKGLVVLGTASGLFLIHHRTLDIAMRLIEHAHLNPSAKYPQIFLDAAQHFQDTRLLLLALATAAYCALRFVEAYGLFYEKAWAEVLAAASGAIYVPFEVMESLRHPHVLNITILGLNLAVVGIMLHALWQRRAQRLGKAPDASLRSTIRSMQPADMPDVMAIQADCYTAIVPESRISMEEKLRASPSSCFVACIDNRIVGYLLALPWTFSTLPQLDTPECRLPTSPDCLYLHDLAVAPTARNSGAGQQLVAACMQYLTEMKLGHACLIAIQSSVPYWQKQGFHIVPPNDAQRIKLASYGTDAVLMIYQDNDNAERHSASLRSNASV